MNGYRMTNHPPYAVLSLDEGEYEYMVKLLALSNRGARSSMEDVCSMTSDDERVPYRAMLTMAAAVDLDMTNCLCAKLAAAKEGA